MPSKNITDCGRLLAEKKLTIAFAESATAGRACFEFSLVPESGQILLGGLVCYDAGIKEDLLKISPELVEKHTPESAEVTKELAWRLPTIIKADITVGITGLTTPGGSETPEKPVGTMFIHVVINGKDTGVKNVYTGTPEEIVMQTVNDVAVILLKELRSC